MKDETDLAEYMLQRVDAEFERYVDFTPEKAADEIKFRSGSDEFYAIEVKDTGKVIGNIYLGHRDFEARELGYVLNENYQRMGYGREAYFRENVSFRKDKDGNPIYWDTYVYAKLANE